MVVSGILFGVMQPQTKVEASDIPLPARSVTDQCLLKGWGNNCDI